MRHDPAGQRPADNPGNHRGHKEHRGDACTQRRREPVGQVQNHPRKEAGLGYAEEKTRDDQLIGAGDKRRAHSDQAPQHHDPRQCGAGADALQVHIARHFKKDVAQVENPGPNAVGGIAEGNIFGHAQLGERHVQAIDGVERIGQKQVRQQPQDDLAIHQTGFILATDRQDNGVVHGHLPGCRLHRLGRAPPAAIMVLHKPISRLFAIEAVTRQP
ncbi:hypothetical protein D3C78_1193110 [compost metagenome]